MTDRFSKATEELAEKNAFICESCNLESRKASSGEHLISVERLDEPEGRLQVTGLDIASTRLERGYNIDPTPFGP